jgi:glycogen debranching enzyme
MNELTGIQAGGIRYVLKEGETFLVADALGDVHAATDGLFFNDTRLLSTWCLRIGGQAPVLLSSGVARNNVVFQAHLTNRQLPALGGSSVPKELLHLSRTRFLHAERMYERLVLTNYGSEALSIPLEFAVAADFRDMFEVRGVARGARGEAQPGEHDAHVVGFGYRGLDGVLRRSLLSFSEDVAHGDEGVASLEVSLQPSARWTLYIEAGAEAEPRPCEARFQSALTQARMRMRRRSRRGARVQSGEPLFAAWMRRSRLDIALLTSELATGPYPYAGIPWFSTPFGRDAVVTALQTLWLDPNLARGVLGFLADHQAQEESAFLDAAPGKIMHETRKGEMSALKELPFGRYYGGVDTTPLFVMLAGEYAARTGDAAFIDRLWPALLAATGWIERVCDANPHGFLDYARGRATGLSNQGWKDSEDSVFHADGRFPVGPIALVEVQGYAYAALRAMARLADRRGDAGASTRWRSRARTLQQSVEERFWMPEHGFYGIAVDGEGQLCRVRASNAGHLLYAGLPAAERAGSVCERLLGPGFNSGWGIRTLEKGQARYNPMSYHNGSLWPHDSALCAAGIARYGEREGTVTLLRSAFDAAVGFDMRLPELFCGFARSAGSPPVAYPVACLPQAWAAGSAFMLLQAALGIRIDGERGEIELWQPQLPAGIDRIVVRELPVREVLVDLVLERDGDRVAAGLAGRTDGIRVVGD